MAAIDDLEEFRRRLEMERRNLRRGMEEQEEEQILEENPDDDDRAGFMARQEVRETLDEFSAGVLERIERALERIEAGTYGSCVKCGKAIPRERLLALPYAELCMECQRPQERRLGGGIEREFG